MATIRRSVESRRGCGYRKGGGLYLVCDGPGSGCGRLPVPLAVCPTCHGGIKPSRGWTTVDGAALLRGARCQPDFFDGGACDPLCVLADANLGALSPAGLIWVGEKFYPTPDDFRREAARMGVSRRIPAVPKDLALGSTWVLLAHRTAIAARHEGGCPWSGARETADDCPEGCVDAGPGIFYAFQPSRAEYVVTGSESEEELDSLEARGLDLVEVVPHETTLPLLD